MRCTTYNTGVVTAYERILMKIFRISGFAVTTILENEILLSASPFFDNPFWTSFSEG